MVGSKPRAKSEDNGIICRSVEDEQRQKRHSETRAGDDAFSAQVVHHHAVSWLPRRDEPRITSYL